MNNRRKAWIILGAFVLVLLITLLGVITWNVFSGLNQFYSHPDAQTSDCIVSGASVCSITVASTGKRALARTAVLISATATCTVPAGLTFQSASASVEVTQVSHQQAAQGFGSVNLTTCDGTAQTVQVAVTPFRAPFHGGSAFATGTTSACFLDTRGNQLCTSIHTSPPQVISITG